MKTKFYFLLLIAFLFSITVNAQNVTLTATGGTSTGSFATLTAAFNAINAGTHSGVINISIVNNTTSEGADLTTNAYTSITITPSGARSITGQCSNCAVIELNGASNVTIDGLNTGGNSLLIQNNQTTSQQMGTCAFQIFNGGSNIKLRNCTLLANDLYNFSATTGVVMISTTVASSISGFRMDNCTIGTAANASTPGTSLTNYIDVFFNCSGTGATILNDTISNCKIQDFSQYGLYVGGSISEAGLVFTGNSFYRTSAYTFNGNPQACIYMNSSTTGGNKILNNFFGGTSANGGTASAPWAIGTNGSSLGFAPIWYATHSTTADSIYGNKIMNFSTGSTITNPGWAGIYIANGSVNIGDGTDANQNVIGNASSTFGISASSTGTPLVAGINIAASSTYTININDNQVENVAYTGTGTNNNQVYGIYWSGLAKPTISNCKIHDLSNATGYTSNSNPVLAGIYTTASGAQAGLTISGNEVYNLTTSGSAVIEPLYGIAINGPSATPAGGRVTGNFIHNLVHGSTNTATAFTAGIGIISGACVYSNNMIQVGLNTSGSSITTGYALYGIRYNPLSTPSQPSMFYHNTVYIGGTSVSSSANTFAFYRQFDPSPTTTKDTLENNIFFNNRQNNTGSANNYAIADNGVEAKLISNFNDLYAATTNMASIVSGSATATNFAGWKGQTVAQDGSSISSDPLLTTPNGSPPDFHLTNGTPCDAVGTAMPTVTTDYYGNLRSSFTPTDLGAVAFVPSAGIALADIAGSALGAASIPAGSTSVVYQFQTAVTVATTSVTAVTFSTSGTYSVSDVSNFKLWYNSSNSYPSGATQIGSSITTSLGGGSHSFSSLTQSISSGATGYFWITSDVQGGATVGRTVIVSAMANTNVTVSSGTVTGSSSAGGTQTISSGCTGVTIATQPSTPSSVCSGNGTANIGVGVSGTSSFNYTWQISANGTSGWTDLTNTSPYGSTAVTTGTTATTNTLTITNPSSGLNGQWYRATITNCAGANSVSSNAVQLTVNTSPATPSVSVNNVCGSSTLSTTASGSLSWSSGQTTSAITVTNTATYTVTSTSGGCGSIGTGNSAPIAIPATPTVTVGSTCATTNVLSTTASGSLSWSYGGATTSTITVTATGTYSVNATSGGCTSGYGTGTVSTIPTGLNSNVHGVYTIGGSSPDYASFGAAITGMAGCGVTGPVIFEVRNGTYTESITAVAVSGASSTNTITFRPESGGTVTLTSNTLSTGNATLTFNGASYFIFEGRQGGSGTAYSFSIINTATSANTIQYINDATYDNIQYCNVQGGSNTLSGGLIRIGTSTGSTGNDFITIDHNKIGSSTMVGMSIWALGTSGATNSDISITNNEIFNFGAATNSYGINVTSTGNGSNWNISGNSFYCSGSPSFGQFAVIFQPGASAGGNTFSNNYIGGSAANCGGSAWTNSTTYGMVGLDIISVGTSSSSPTVISGNTIQNISTSDFFTGIYVGAGSAKILNNQIGHPTTANSIITNGGSSGGAADLYGIHVLSSQSVKIDSNNVQNIKASSTSNDVYGIHIIASGSSDTITHNKVLNVFGGGNFSGQVIYGIYLAVSSATNNVVEDNQVQVGSTYGFPIVGIYANGSSSGGSISRNKVTGFYESSVTDIYGIYVAGSGSYTVSNNFIRTNNNGYTNGSFIYGILDANTSGTNNYYYNSILISAAVSGNTYAFIRGNSSTGTVNVYDNILVNNSSGSGSNYALANAAAASNWNGNYNFLANSNSATIGRWSSADKTFSTWQSSSGQDANSKTATTTSGSSSSTLVNPSELFIDATNGDLHIGGNNTAYAFVSNVGTVLSVTTDIDGDSRTSTPDMGADEFVPCTPPSAPTVTVTNACGSTVLSTTATGTLSWSNGVTTTAITVTNAATYSVTQTVSACTSAAGTGTSAPYSSPSASASQVNVLCNGGSTGTATSTTTGGSTPYTYIWSTTATTSSITGLAAATYTLTVTDVHTCSSTTTVTITQPSALSASASQTNPSCNGGSNGTATSTTSGGTAPYTYAWSTGSTLSSITALSANTYTLTVTDTHSCTSTTTVTLTNPAAIPTPSVTVTSACGSSVLSTTATGTLSWSPGGSTASSISVTGTATYSVTQTIGGCTSPLGTGTAAPYSTPTASASHTDASCNGFSDGIATSTTTGGTTPYAYLWSPGGSTNSSISGLSSSTYTLTVTDAHGCTSIGTVGVGQPGPVSTPSVTVANGCGSSVLSTTSTGTLSWSNGASSSAITVTNSATYSVTTTNGSGCTSAAGTGTSAPNSGPTASASHTDVSCHGGTNGTATSTSSGGTTPYTYSWSSGETTSSISSKAAGTYTLTVSDTHTCSSTTTVTISEPSVLSASAGHTDVTCAGGDGTATSTTSGGTTPYTYAWSSGETTSSISGKAAGTYTLTVTDTHSCTSSTTATIGASSGCGLTYTVKVFLQGYYIGSGDMSPLLKLLNASSSPTAVDTVTIELHASGTTANYTYTGILQSNGNIVCSFTSAAAGSYYVVVKHRNSLTTYSASAQTISDGGSYDFTTGAGQAYGSGNRMANVGGSYAIYGGDINGDGSINISDKTSLQSALSSFTIGSYDVHDITGDGFVDEDDLRILQNNIPLSLTVQHP